MPERVSVQMHRSNEVRNLVAAFRAVAKSDV